MTTDELIELIDRQLTERWYKRKAAEQEAREKGNDRDAYGWECRAAGIMECAGLLVGWKGLP